MRDAFEEKWLEKFSQAAKNEGSNRDQSLLIEGNPYYREYFLEYSSAVFSRGNTAMLVLDVGCGTGSTCRVLAEKGFQVYGVDFSSEIIEVAKKKARENDISLHLQAANIYQLPFPNGMFDVVICNYLFQTVSEPEKVLKEAWRVLKTNGSIFIITLNALSIGRILLHDEVKFYNPYRFKKTMEQIGFQNNALKGIYFFPKPFDGVARWILSFKIYKLFNALFFPFFIFFSHSFYLEAKKT